MKSARKSSYHSALPRLTTRDIIAFKKQLEIVKRPEEPLEGRDEYLKLHPVCEGCKNERCALLTTDDFGVRCVQCVRKHVSCPRQISFWVLCIAQRMSKPTPWVAEMYQLYGHHVQPRYDAPASSSSNRHFSDDDFVVESSEEEETREYESQKRSKHSLTAKGSSHGTHVRFSSPVVASSNSSKSSSSEIRVERRSSEKGQVKVAQSKVTSSQCKESDGLSKIYSLVARFAICRDRIRSASRPFVDDTRAKRLMAMLSELDTIGEEFSEVLGDVDMETTELRR